MAINKDKGKQNMIFRAFLYELFKLSKYLNPDAHGAFKRHHLAKILVVANNNYRMHASFCSY